MLGFTGTFEGAPISVQTTGMGCPSAGIVFEELVMLGATRLIRVGTCGGSAGPVSLADTVVGLSATCEDTAPLRYADMEGWAPAATYALVEAAVQLGREAGATVHVGPIVTSSVFYDPDHERPALGTARPPRHRDGGRDALHDRRRARHRGAGDHDRQRHPRGDRGRA